MFLKAILAAVLSVGFVLLILCLPAALTFGMQQLDAVVTMSLAQMRRGLLQYIVPIGWFAVIAFDMLSIVLYRAGIEEENREIELRQDSRFGALSRQFKWSVFYPLVSVALILLVLLG
jgi:hypothetical protein